MDALTGKIPRRVHAHRADDIVTLYGCQRNLISGWLWNMERKLI